MKFQVGDRVKYVGTFNPGTISTSVGTVAKVVGSSLRVIHDTKVNCSEGGRNHRCWSSSFEEFEPLGERVDECFWEQLPIVYEKLMNEEVEEE